MGYTTLNVHDYYSSDGLFTPHQPRFLKDPRFDSAYRRGIEASRGVDPHMEWRAHITLWVASRALSVEGDFVECGVNAGFLSSAVMQYLNWRSTGRRFFLVDTFAGPPLSQYSNEEVREGRDRAARQAIDSGAYVTDLERVRANFSEWPNAIVVPGEVPGVLGSLQIETVAFLHLDLNAAAPECAALEFFWPHLSPHGLILLDDYAYFRSTVQGDALDDAAKRLGTEILALPTGQGLISR